jgi:hypothetical protein
VTLTFTPPAHTGYAWQNAPSTATPLDAAHLGAAEADLVAYTQSALAAYDAYAKVFVRASANGIAPGNTAAANASAMATLIGAGGALANGGTLLCDWVGTATFDTSSSTLTPAAGNLTVRGLGWATVMRLAPESSTNSALSLWTPSGTSSMSFVDICLQGPDVIGAGGANMLVLHTGTSGEIRLRNVWARRATFLVELNPSSGGSNVSIHASDCLFEGYGTVNSSTCIGAFDSSPTAWTPSRRIAVSNSRFFNFGDPAGGALRHAIYAYTSWGLSVSDCLFDTPAATNTGYCIQHYDSSVTGTAIAQESRVAGCTFGSNLASTHGVVTDYNYPTTIADCVFDNGGLSTFGSDVEVAGDVVIEGCSFAHKDAQSIEFFSSGTAQISGCRFSGALGGGCASINNNGSGAVVQVNDCRFTGATGANGAYCWLDSNGEMHIRDCRFEGNPNRAVYGTAAGILSIAGSRFLTASNGIETATTALAELHVRENDFAPSGGASGVFTLGVTPTVLDIAYNYGSVGFPTTNGGVSTQTPGAVTTVNIPHGLGNSSHAVTPKKFTVQPSNTLARGLSAFSVTATSTNLVLTFASALAASTSYAWQWFAEL